MPRAGLRKIIRYSAEFKVAAVKLSALPGVLIKDIARELDIQPRYLANPVARQPIVARFRPDTAHV